MKHLVLVEGPPADLRTGVEDDVVALTPGACYWLEKRAVAYRIPADFGTEEALLEIEDGFWDEELAWFDEVDALLHDRCPELERHAIQPASLYGYQLKTLLDNLFIRGVELTTLLRRGSDDVILWPGAPAASSGDFFGFCLEQRGVYPRLVEHICGARGIRYRVMEPPSPPESTPPGSSWPRLKAGVKQWQLSLQAFAAAGRSPRRRLTLLFLEWGPYLGDLLRHALREGHRCLVLTGDRVVDVSRGGRCVSRPGELPRIEGAAVARWKAAAAELFAPESALWKWPDSWFGCSVAPLLADCLKAWVGRELASMVRSMEAFHALYEREGVDFVLAPFLMGRLHFPAFAACSRSVFARSVLVADGDGPDVAKVWDLTELFRSQHYFVPDAEFADYFEQRRALYPTRPTARVHVGSRRWHRYTRLGRRPHVYLQRWEGRRAVHVDRPPLRVPTDRPIVVYVTSRLETDVRYLNRPNYSECWYYRLQTHLVRAFAEMPEYTFIVKLFPGQDSASSAIGKTVRDLGAPNLRLSSSPLRHWFPWADRVILDIPSTPLYEVALAGIPFHLLVHRALAMRPRALEKFRGCVTFFDRPDEAAAAIQSYLRAPHVGKRLLQPEGPEITTTLVRLAAEARGGGV